MILAFAGEFMERVNRSVRVTWPFDSFTSTLQNGFPSGSRVTLRLYGPRFQVLQSVVSVRVQCPVLFVVDVPLKLSLRYHLQVADDISAS